MRLFSLVCAWVRMCRAIGLLGFTVVSLFYSAYAYSAGLGGCDIITSCLKPGALTDTVRVALSISLIATHPGAVTRHAVLPSQLLRRPECSEVIVWKDMSTNMYCRSRLRLMEDSGRLLW